MVPVCLCIKGKAFRGPSAEIGELQSDSGLIEGEQANVISWERSSTKGASLFALEECSALLLWE